jgi:hypothetical protein
MDTERKQVEQIIFLMKSHSLIPNEKNVHIIRTGWLYEHGSVRISQKENAVH